MHIESREITYRSVVEQIFFEDQTELVVTVGWPEGQEHDLDIIYDWVTGEPEYLQEYLVNVSAGRYN
jgi:hypothetical protein